MQRKNIKKALLGMKNEKKIAERTTKQVKRIDIMDGVAENIYESPKHIK